jgi:alkylhydroperoxidase family enzyme
MSEIYSGGDEPCAVPLAPVDGAAGIAVGAFNADVARYGHVLNRTRATIASPTVWQALTRSEHMFATLRRIDARTCALLCLYTSLLNGCAYCTDDAAGVALELGVPADTLLRLPDLPATEDDEKLRLALRYAEQVALDPGAVDPGLHAELRDRLDDEELLELTAVVAMKCFWNHFAKALRLPPEGRCTDQALFRALRERSHTLALRHEPV